MSLQSQVLIVRISLKRDLLIETVFFFITYLRARTSIFAKVLFFNLNPSPFPFTSAEVIVEKRIKNYHYN